MRLRLPLLAAAATVVLLVLAERPAAARCPHSGWPSMSACRDMEAYLMPGVVGMGYFPKDAGGAWFGGGVQIAPLIWSHNTEKFGPGQGKLIFDIGLLDSTDESLPGSLLLYRVGAQLSFERNASRTIGIPFFGATFGGLNNDTLGDAGFFEATAGVHVVFYKNIAFSLEGGYLFPFDKVDQLAGWRSTAAVNFTMW